MKVRLVKKGLWHVVNTGPAADERTGMPYKRPHCQYYLQINFFQSYRCNKCEVLRLDAPAHAELSDHSERMFQNI